MTKMYLSKETKEPMMKANLTEEELNKYLKKKDKKKVLPKGIFETIKKKD